MVAAALSGRRSAATSGVRIGSPCTLLLLLEPVALDKFALAESCRFGPAGTLVPAELPGSATIVASVAAVGRQGSVAGENVTGQTNGSTCTAAADSAGHA